MANESIPQIPVAPQGGDANATNQANIPRGRETSESFKQSVNKSHQVRGVVGTVIKTRQQLKLYFEKFGIELLTSASILDETGDFIASSIIIFKDNNITEELSDFIIRQPEFAPMVEQVAINMKGFKNQTGLRTRKTSNIRDYLN